MTDRSRARYFRAAATALSSVGAKGLAGVISLASVPLTLGYLGAERFGLWMAIASLQAIFAFADFGLGNGVLNTVAEACGRGDHATANRAVRSAFVLQSSVAATLFLAFWIVYPHVDWSRLLHVSDPLAVHEAPRALFIFVALFCARSVVQVVQQAQYGQQMGYISNAWTAFGNLAALVALFVAASNHAGVPMLCLAVSGPPVLSGMLNSAWWMATRLSNAAARAGAWQAQDAQLGRMMRVGLLFFLLQVTATLQLGIDPLIVNQVLGPKAVASLALVQKPFELFSILLLLLLQPLWPAYREAITSGDVSWVRKTSRRALALSLTLAVCIALLMITEGRHLIRIWAGSQVHPDQGLIVAYCTAHLFLASQTPLAYFFNGLGKIRFQLLLAIPAILASILIKILLTPVFGLATVPYATVLVGVLIMLPAQTLYVKRVTSRLLQIGAGGGIPNNVQTSPAPE